MSKKLRVNQQIRVPNVRLIDDEGNQLGVIPTEEAIAMAQQRNLDLAEVSPNVDPPVCKILDYGKYQYHQKKVAMKHRKMQKKMEVKGIRMGFKTGDNDLKVKAKQAQRFLEAGHSVKVSLIFRGREAMYKDLAIEKMKKFHEELQDYAKIELAPKSQGNTLLMILTPNKQ